MTEDLRSSLLEKYSPSTVKIYLMDIERYICYMGKEKAEKAGYRDVMEYVEYLRKEFTNAHTISRMLYGVKAWYFYLIQAGKREDHPCRRVRLRDSRGRDVQLQDLFTAAEMERLMQRQERYGQAGIRNRVVVSLLIYQGLRLTEIARLRLGDVDLEAGTVHVRPMRRTMGRVLSLKVTQVMLFYSYIMTVRPGLLKTDTDRLVLTLRGSAENGEGINYLVETFKPLFPERNLNARTIRQSVITNMLKDGADLRVVQVFAGHKKISTTEKYRQSGLEELQVYILIEKYTTFSLKSIPLIMLNQLLWERKSNTKTDDKYGYETGDYKAVFS